MWTSQNTDDGTMRWWSDSAQLHGQLPSVEMALWMAQRYTVYSGQMSDFDPYMDDMLRANPGRVMGPYVKGPTFQGSATFLPDRWYARDPQGNKIVTFGKNVFLCHPDVGPSFQGHPNFRSWHAAEIKAEIMRWVKAGLPLQAVLAWIDSMADFAYQGPPCYPGTNDVIPKDEWLAKCWTILDAVAAVLPDVFLMVNGGRLSTKPWWDKAMGLMTENWIKKPVVPTGPTPTSVSDSFWRGQVDTTLQIQATKGRNGRPLVTECAWRHTHDHTEAEKDLWRSFMTCSFLLSNRGSAYFEATTEQAEPWATKEYEQPMYNVNFGQPRESPASAAAMLISPAPSGSGGGGVYARSFERGVAMVSTARVPMEVKPDLRVGTISLPPMGSRLLSV